MPGGLFGACGAQALRPLEVQGYDEGIVGFEDLGFSLS